MTRLIAIIALLAIAASATPTVVIGYSDTAGATTQTGNLVAGSQPTIVFRNASGAWATGAVYTLTIKGDGQYDATPFVLVSGAAFTKAGADLTVTVNLNVTELYTYLGRADARTAMLELSDASAIYMVRHRVIINNSVRRPTDTAPANPGANTYTDAEVDALIGAIPAGVTPVASAVDGWTVQTDAVGQIEMGPFASVLMCQVLTEYPETTTLATGDYLLVWDASESALRKVSLATLLTWIQAQ
jgi:hypothetical protein